jgi:hypothetical protein
VPLTHHAAGAGRGRPVAGGSWSGGQPSPQAASPSPLQRQLIDGRVAVFKCIGALILGATPATMNLVGLAAVALRSRQPNEGRLQDALVSLRNIAEGCGR